MLRRKMQTESYSSRQQPWNAAAPCTIQGPYAFSDITKLPPAALSANRPPNIRPNLPRDSSADTQCDYYENVPSPHRESGFVTNDIYEICRAQNRRCPTGWVENEIYG